MNEAATKTLSSTNDPSHIVEPAACLAILATDAAILLLAALHIVSPEFSPSWRVISEYAFGRYGWVLSLMFLSAGIGTWALAAAIWTQVHTKRDGWACGFCSSPEPARRWLPFLTSRTK